MDVRPDAQTGVNLQTSSFSHVVSLLAWHSLGVALGSTLAGWIFQQASPKLIIILSMVVHGSCLLALGLQAHPSSLEIAVLRGLSGLVSALPLIYLPLWVDEYSPSEGSGQWMAIIQMGAPLGQFLGVIVAALATGAAFPVEDIRFAFLVQAALIVPVTFRLLIIPAVQVDVSNISALRTRLDSVSLHPAEASQLGHIHSWIREMKEMLQGASRNPLTVSLTSTLVVLQATAFGLAIWAAPYLALGDAAPSPMVSLLTAAFLLSLMPAAGTCAGALFCERLDGFKAGHHAVALRVACSFIGLAALAGLASGWAKSFLVRMLIIAVWLFGAGAFLPISVGILMTCMPSYLRSFSSSSSVLAFHVFSFALVPMFISGSMNCFSVPEKGLNFGIGLLLSITVPVAVLLLCSYLREPRGCAPASSLSSVDDLSFGDISYELARRRMSTAPL
eukprot:TRINITY_DN13425_c1_g1_i1.p1 TRINITY_DN13425_c1_g1~~TRINITY_DN13425_c1_g1_i1.p1  ORF type:complete len:511 (+),score=55.23 TRINITY_DN13425_c1_g1_i1:195-1535(+)